MVIMDMVIVDNYGNGKLWRLWITTMVMAIMDMVMVDNYG